MPWWLAVIGGIVSFGSAIQAGNEKRRRAEQAAYDAELEKEQLAIIALEEENDRSREYAEISGTALAMAAARNNLMNLKTLEQRGLEGYERDIQRVSRGSMLKRIRIQRQADEYRRSGKAEQRASYTTGFAQLMNNGYDSSDTWYPAVTSKFTRKA
mgnify:FL=1